MRTASDSLAQLASALAKAQLELSNPSKSSVATLDGFGSRGESKSYRYAPLSSGLEVARKVLGKHELAVIQTTDVDGESGTLMLTTTLAHGSGEWICGFWPVCPVADLSHPRVMGAALTYARRYGLFAMIGIAGEDDLDASDFVRAEENRPAAPPALPRSVGFRVGTRRKRRDAGIRRGPQRRSNRVAVSDLDLINEVDALFEWALNILPARSALDDASRAALDEAFLSRARTLGADPELLCAFVTAPGLSQQDGATLGVFERGVADAPQATL